MKFEGIHSFLYKDILFQLPADYLLKDRDSTAPKRGSVFIGLMTRGARYYRYTDKPRCGLEKIRIAIRFGRIDSLGNLR